MNTGKPIQAFVESAGVKVPFDGMTVEDYLAIQLEYHKRTSKHFDEKTYSWLFGSLSGSRVPWLLWNPEHGCLYALANDPGYRHGLLAPRPAAVFTLGIGNENFSDFDFGISAEFENPESGAKESISIDFEKELAGWQKFYQEKRVEVPADLAEEVVDVFERNRAEMEKAMEEMGYDKAIIVPPNLDAVELHQKMTEGWNKTHEYSSFKEAGGFAAITTPNYDKVRIVLVHEKGARNNGDHPILKKLRGKSVVDVSGLAPEKVQEMLDNGENIPMKITIGGKSYAFGGLDVQGYLIWQREYAERNSAHIDEEGWSSLPGSAAGSRVPGLHWSPGHGCLGADAHGPGFRPWGEDGPGPARRVLRSDPGA